MAATKTTKSNKSNAATKPAETQGPDKGEDIQATEAPREQAATGQANPGSDDQSPVAVEAASTEEVTETTLEPAPADDTQEVTSKRISVRSRHGGFRRGGFQFNDRADTVLDVRKLSEEQLAAIMDEPQLIVRPLGQEG